MSGKVLCVLVREYEETKKNPTVVDGQGVSPRAPTTSVPRRPSDARFVMVSVVTPDPGGVGFQTGLHTVRP